MRDQLAYAMTAFSVRNSEKLKKMSMIIVIISAIIIIGFPLITAGDGMLSGRIPIYVLAFNFIFITFLIAEYSAVWFKNEERVHQCRCVCSLVAIGMTMFELRAFFLTRFSSHEETQFPFSLSSLIAHLIS